MSFAESWASPNRTLRRSRRIDNADHDLADQDFPESQLSDVRLSLTVEMPHEALGAWLDTQRECFAEELSHPGQRDFGRF
jgi:hypothetical protein